ncbi:MAG: hypothetical protein GX604_01895 [Actinobacteria bacterium]|nr:hypothetical protein [Actinomycetota bacterium]
MSELRAVGITLHVARKKKHSAIGSRDELEGLRHEPEEAQARGGGLRLNEDGGITRQASAPRAKARWVFQFTAAVYNLVRMRSLLGDCTAALRGLGLSRA